MGNYINNIACLDKPSYGCNAYKVSDLSLFYNKVKIYKHDIPKIIRLEKLIFNKTAYMCNFRIDFLNNHVTKIDHGFYLTSNKLKIYMKLKNVTDNCVIMLNPQQTKSIEALEKIIDYTVPKLETLPKYVA